LAFTREDFWQCAGASGRTMKNDNDACPQIGRKMSEETGNGLDTAGRRADCDNIDPSPPDVSIPLERYHREPFEGI